ncbi:hypothetical protein MKX67_01260 [Cytobacillus sp. FSL W7-1323]|nr:MULTISPECIES: hypothetical protein [Cytobacillus]MEA1854792.1 hypothetical protein [Cytobacillus sp. OWB-43]
MIGFIAVLFSMLGFFLIINMFLAILYFFSSRAGGKFYSWITEDFVFLMILSIPFFALTELTANELYNRFNGFLARILLIFYIITLFILAIVFFILFGYFAEMG